MYSSSLPPTHSFIHPYLPPPRLPLRDLPLESHLRPSPLPTIDFVTSLILPHALRDLEAGDAEVGAFDVRDIGRGDDVALEQFEASGFAQGGGGGAGSWEESLVGEWF